MKLRLYHHPDGARVAYRETGTGPGLAILHSAMLSHREFAPVVEDLALRYRVVLPDLPLHGDSEDRPRHPYTLDWLTEVLAGFIRDTCGPRPLVAGHELGAELLLRAVASGQLHPSRMVLMPSALHRSAPARRVWRVAARAGGLPILDRAASHGAKLVLRPKVGVSLTAQANPAARDLVRHAVADSGGNPNLARSWAKFARSWPQHGARREVLEELAAVRCPTLLLWADTDVRHPLEIAEEALDLLRDGQLRVLSKTGFLIAYDDPVGVARELAAFFG
ncbi:MAG: alpha/beta hydrolase fold protein [Solirubrobacterales bacterium]|jgi:pimeloyl-ACP methyl ester carboxylesterase|nr:alpha/beta hydrolase fold protein [Solirubrobacterales bacterium]